MVNKTLNKTLTLACLASVMLGVITIPLVGIMGRDRSAKMRLLSKQ